MSLARTSCSGSLMITYYVDKTPRRGAPEIPRLMRQGQQLRGRRRWPASSRISISPTTSWTASTTRPRSTTLPYTDAVRNVTYNSNQIRKVNIHMGVRSEIISKPTQDYVRNHISTSVDVRSLASVDRYVTD